MTKQKKSAQTAATVQSAKATYQEQFIPNSGKTQDLFSVLSDLDCTATNFDELKDLLQLTIEGLEDEAPKGDNPDGTDCKIFVMRVRLYLSSLHVAWGMLYDQDKELNSTIKRGYETLRVQC